MKQKVKRSKQLFEEQKKEMQNEIEKRRMNQVKIGNEKHNRKINRFASSQGRILGQESKNNNESEENKDLIASLSVVRRKTSKLKFFQKQETLEDLEVREANERQMLYETTRELEKIKYNIEKLKKETNLNSIEDICQSYKKYEETNTRLSNEIHSLDEEIVKLSKEIEEIKRDVDKEKGIGKINENKKAREEHEKLNV